MADYRDYAREEAQRKRQQELFDKRVKELTLYFLENGFNSQQAKALAELFTEHEKSRSHKGW